MSVIFCGVCMYVRQGGQVVVRGHFLGQFSPATMWVGGTELKPSGLAAGAFTH